MTTGEISTFASGETVWRDPEANIAASPFPLSCGNPWQSSIVNLDSSGLDLLSVTTVLDVVGNLVSDGIICPRVSTTCQILCAKDAKSSIATLSESKLPIAICKNMEYGVWNARHTIRKRCHRILPIQCRHRNHS